MGLLLSAAVVEGYFRLFAPQLTYERLPQTKSGCFRAHPIYFVEQKPNSTCRFVTPEFDTTVPINNLGFNSVTDTQIQKENGTKRIVFVGDSFTFGEGVRPEENYPAIVGQLIKKVQPHAEIINAGMAGIGIDWYYLTLKEKLLALSPDLVVVGVHIGTDLSDDFLYFTTPETDAEDLPTRMTSTLQYVDLDGTRRYSTTPLRYRIPILRSLHTFIYIATLLKGPFTPSDGGELTGTPCLISPGCTNLDENFKKAAKRLIAMDTLARQNGAKLLVVLIPWEYQMPRTLLSRLKLGIYVDTPRRHYPSDRLHTQLAEQRVSVVDLLPAFEAYRGNEELLYPFDRHWTSAGHKLVAETLTPIIESELTGATSTPSAEQKQ